MRIHAKARLIADALSDWQKSITTTYGTGTTFKSVGNMYRAFLGGNQVGEFRNGDALVFNEVGDSAVVADAISEPGIIPDDDMVSDGTAYQTLIDGDPDTEDPIVQNVTRDDGGVVAPEEQDLLMDDISLPKGRR